MHARAHPTIPLGPGFSASLLLVTQISMPLSLTPTLLPKLIPSHFGGLSDKTMCCYLLIMAGFNCLSTFVPKNTTST